MKTKSREKIVGLDMDGVIVDHTNTKIFFGRWFGFDLYPHETASDLLKQKIDHDAKELLQAFLYDNPYVGILPKVMPGAEEGLRFLKSNRVPFYVISRRKKDKADVGVLLLKERGLWPDFLNEKNVFFVDTKEDKNNKAKELGITVYIDDQPSVLEKLVDVPHKLLLDSYRVHVESPSYRRVTSWGELLRVLME